MAECFSKCMTNPMGESVAPLPRLALTETIFAAENEATQAERMQDGTLQKWLKQRLVDQRREVLLLLEAAHGRLIEDFLLQTSPSPFTPISREKTSDSNTKRLMAEKVPMPTGIANELPIEDDTLEVQPGSKESNRMASNTISDIAKLEQIEACLREGDDRSDVAPDQTSATRQHDDSGHKQKVENNFRGYAFEGFFGLVIIANACVMAMNQQYRGLQYGYDLSIRTYVTPRDEAWPGGKLTFNVLEKFFTGIFTLEWVSRLAMEGRKFLMDWWCYLDGTIITFAWVGFFVDDVMNPTFVRLARIAKLFRLVRLVRSNEIFDSLKVFVASIRASVNTLFWTLLILLMIQSVAGLLMCQTLEAFLEDKNQDVLIQRRVFEYWGTFWRAIITMFEITFANWVPSCRLLVDHVDEAYGTFYLLYRCAIGFCVLMVVQAVFIQQTMKTTQLDDEFLMAQKARTKAKFVRRLMGFFQRLDKSEDGFLEWEEFVEALKDGDMKVMLEVFELEVDDISTLFTLLDDGDGRISIEEFVTGVEHMKGPARAVDLMEVKQSLKVVEAKLGVRPNSRGFRMAGARSLKDRSVRSSTNF